MKCITKYRLFFLPFCTIPFHIFLRTDLCFPVYQPPKSAKPLLRCVLQNTASSQILCPVAMIILTPWAASLSLQCPYSYAWWMDAKQAWIRRVAASADAGAWLSYKMPHISCSRRESFVKLNMTTDHPVYLKFFPAVSRVCCPTPCGEFFELFLFAWQFYGHLKEGGKTEKEGWHGLDIQCRCYALWKICSDAMLMWWRIRL